MGGGPGWTGMIRGGRGSRRTSGVGPGSGRLRVDEAAALAERAGVVVGALGVADLAAVLDEVDVRLVHLVGLEQAEDEVVAVVERSPWAAAGRPGA